MALDQRILDYIDKKHIQPLEQRILEGAISGETAEQRAINYGAAVLHRRTLFSIRQALIDFTKTSEAADEGNLQPMPEQEGAKR